MPPRRPTPHARHNVCRHTSRSCDRRRRRTNAPSHFRVHTSPSLPVLQAAPRRHVESLVSKPAASHLQSPNFPLPHTPLRPQTAPSTRHHAIPHPSPFHHRGPTSCHLPGQRATMHAATCPPQRNPSRFHQKMPATPILGSWRVSPHSIGRVPPSWAPASPSARPGHPLFFLPCQ